MSAPRFLRFTLSALLLLQTAAGSIAARSVRVPAMACCRMRGQCGRRCDAGAAATHARQVAALPGACVLDVGACRHSPAGVPTPAPASYPAAKERALPPPQPERVAARTPVREHVRLADPPLSPPPRA